MKNVFKRVIEGKDVEQGKKARFTISFDLSGYDEEQRGKLSKMLEEYCEEEYDDMTPENMISEIDKLLGLG